MRPLLLLSALWLLLVALLPPSTFHPSAPVSGPSTAHLPSVLFTTAASWASPTATFVDGPLLSVQSLNVSGALHIGQINVEAKLTAMQSQIDALSALLTELSGRMTDAEQLNGSPPSPLVTAVTSQADTMAGLATRLSAAENLNGTATALTTTVKQVRDLTTGTALFSAVNGLRTLTAGTALTNTVLGLRDLTAAGGSMVTAVKQAQTNVTALSVQMTQAYANDTALADRLSAAETISAPMTALTATLTAVRDFTSGTPLYTIVTGYNTRLTALETLSGTPTSTLYTTVSGYGTRLSAAENLNGAATPLTNTVKQVRDLTTGTPLFTAVNDMRTLVAGSNLTDTLLALRDGTGNSALVTSLHSLQNHSACCGTTPPGNTNWTVYGGGGATNYVDVSLASCGFTRMPTVLTSLTGTLNHFMSIGATSIYPTPPSLFRVYVTAVNQGGGSINTTPMTPAAFNSYLWAVAWCAFV
jgi:hypothetical protein